MNAREKNIAAALLAPDSSPLGLRRVSPASLTMLQMLGNPLADLRLDGALYFDLLQFAWLHSAPLQTVRALVVQEATTPGTVADAVLQWAEELPANYLAQLATELATEFDRTSAAMAISAESSTSKHECGRSLPSA